MGKPTIGSRLSRKLLTAVLFALVFAGGLFFLVRHGLNLSITYRYRDGTLESAYLDSAAQRLRKYAASTGLHATDWHQIDAWTRQEKHVNLIVIKDNRVYFDSFYTQEEFFAYRDELYVDEYRDWLRRYRFTFCEVKFADGTGEAFLLGRRERRERFVATILSFFVASIGGMGSLLLFIRNKTRYIVLLGDELHIMEGGDLQYPITVRGDDELGDLAAGIEAMRLAFIQRLESEERAHAASQKLATAMSHDLRTPLTSLIGYLEILAQEKYADREQMGRYIDSSRAKAYQIKELSDKLFEYFLVSELDEAEEGEELLCIPLMDQLVGEGVFDLESEGFSVTYTPLDRPCAIRGDANLLRRGIGNLFSNISRYGDKDRPVGVACRLEGDLLLVTLFNGVGPDRELARGTGIGLKVCALMASQHGGRFAHSESGGVWSAELSLPVTVDAPG